MPYNEENIYFRGLTQMKIPTFMDRDEYLQNPIMRRFLKVHGLELTNSRADYINTIEKFANRTAENEKEVHEWLLKVVKEGNKEFCYKKIYKLQEWQRDPLMLEAKIKELFPECPGEDVLSYHNTGKKAMIEYHITTNDTSEAIKIDFVFSQLFLTGELDKLGDGIVYPVFIEIYLQDGFIVSRAKPKSTLYRYDENNRMITGDDRISTMDHARAIIEEIVNGFGFVTQKDSRAEKNLNVKMLYKLYEKYSFTPADVVQKVEAQNDLIEGFINQLFAKLSLDVRNKPKAIIDGKILAEKFISINGNNEDVFKKDRPAYLVKVTADDELDLTRIDTASSSTIPLQCTEAFFDSKKSVMKSKQCGRIGLVFKRNDDKYFPKSNQLVVLFGINKGYGYVKTKQYAEEVDIQNVLQAIFENYECS